MNERHHDPNLMPGHPDYLAPRSGKDALCRNISIRGYVCTRGRFHKGRHAGHGFGDGHVSRMVPQLSSWTFGRGEMAL